MACNKVEFKTVKEAKKEIAKWRNERTFYYKRGKKIQRKKIPSRYYKCPICDFYHITKSK